MEINSHTIVLIVLFSILTFFSACSKQPKASKLCLNDTKFATIEQKIQSSNLLDSLQARETLLKLPLSKLKELQLSTKNCKKTFNFIGKLILDKKDTGIFHLIEEIFVNNTPQILNPPFYNNEERIISKLIPEAERLYFDNLKLKYKKNKLIEKGDLLQDPNLSSRYDRIKENTKNFITHPNKSTYSFTKIAPSKKLWSFDLANDLLSKSIYNVRQRIKTYKENSIQPVFHKGTVILRNEYRVFCLNEHTGKELWSITNSNYKGYEHYNTMRQIHLNSQGYELLVETNFIFTELYRELIAIDIKDILNPKIAWKKKLGEYTISSAPILHNNNLIVGLTNSRSEFWLTAFDSQSSNITWQTYIGTSSFLSPPSTLSLILNKQVLIGTNQGVLININPKDGHINWIKKYEPKLYPMFEYWEKGYYKSPMIDKGFIDFDTQFLGENSSKHLYYKPRESDYLYILDSTTGSTINKILIESKIYTFLGLLDNTLILLKRNISQNNKKTWISTILNLFKFETRNENSLVFIDPDTNKEFVQNLNSKGPLLGVQNKRHNKITFKLNTDLHTLTLGKKDIKHTMQKAPNSKEYWLLSNNYNNSLLGKKRTLLSIFYNAEQQTNELIKTHTSNINEFTKNLNLLFLNPNSISLIKNVNKLIKKNNILFKEIWPHLLKNEKKLQRPSLKSFIKVLYTKYKDEIIQYKDVHLRFQNYLHALEILNSIEIKNLSQIKYKQYKNKISNYTVKGENLSLIPIHIKDTREILPFSILMNRDQVLLIKEDGTILWSQRVFFNRTQYSFPKCTVSAYLFKNILILKDDLNIIALNHQTGKYLWGLTNIIEERLKFSDFKKIFTKNFFNHEPLFLNNKILVAKQETLYLLDMFTGYCLRTYTLPFKETKAITLSENGNIYVLSRELNSIFSIDKTLNNTNIISIPTSYIHNILNKNVYSLEIKKNYTKFFAKNNNIYLATNKILLIIDEKNPNPKNIYKYEPSDKFNFELDSFNNLLFISTNSVQSYTYSNNILNKNWEINLPRFINYGNNSIYGEKGILWVYLHPYFLTDKYLLKPVIEDAILYLTAISIKTGKLLWKARLTDEKIILINISNFIKKNNTISFLISYGKESLVSKPAKLPYLYRHFIFSNVLSIDITNGKLETIDRLPAIGGEGFEDPIIIKTNNKIIYTINGNIMKSL